MRNPKTFRWVPLILIGLLFALQSCALIRGPRPIVVPEGFLAGQRAENYARLFPPLERLQAKGKLTVDRGRLRPGKEYADFTLLALDDQRLRLRADRPIFGQTKVVFDLIINDGAMTLIFPSPGIPFPEAVFFRGPIPVEGTPIGQRFGAEPGALVPIFEIGQRIATGTVAGTFAYRAEPDETILYPEGAEATAGLAEIRIENLSGLPRAAAWRFEPHGRRSSEFTARYLAYDYFEIIEGEAPRLMPSRIEIHGRNPRIQMTIEVTKYLAPAGVSVDKVFQPDYRGEIRQYPLEALGELLGIR